MENSKPEFASFTTLTPLKFSTCCLNVHIWQKLLDPAVSVLSLQDSTISYKCIDGSLTVLLLSKKPGIADKEILHKLKVKHKSLKLIGKAMQIFIADNFTMSGCPKQ